MPLVPSGFFALRTPLLPARCWLGANDDDVANGETHRGALSLRDAVALPEVREALFIASPDLEATIDAWLAAPDGERGRRVERALARYLARMAMRPTPFGLFAGSSVGTVSDRTCFEIGPRSSYRRHGRLDMGYLDVLIAALSRDADVQATLRYRPNTSIYGTAGRVRYVECSRAENADGRGTPATATATATRVHRLTDVSDTRYLRDVLARAGDDPDGVTIADLAAGLADAGTPLESATRFVRDLVEAQLLVPVLPLPVTGQEPLAPLVAALRSHPAARKAADVLDGVHRELTRLDAEPPGVEPSRWRALGRSLESLPVPAELGRLFYVDMTKPASNATLSRVIVAEIAHAVELLHRLTPSPPDPLARFRERFVDRYEGRAVPLLQALDDDTGIGLELADGADGEPLLRTLALGVSRVEGRSLPERDALLLARIESARNHGADEIVLDRRDIDSIADIASPRGAPPTPLPRALAAVATLAATSGAAADRGEFRVHVTGFAGPSGARLLGRFCHGDDALHAHVMRHMRAEEALDPGAAYAEVVHLPDGRIGNILARPLFRELELVYLGDSGAPRERQILAADLLVSVEDNAIVLRTARDRTRVVPRLTSAHNFELGVPVYRFLCLLQSQGVVQGGAWQWGALDARPFLPRVRTGRLVLSLARWRVRPDEIRDLKTKSGTALLDAVHDWRIRRSIPRRVTVADGDNALPVDLQSTLGAEVLVHLLKDRQRDSVVQEIFPGEDELCVSGPEGRFTHELVVPFVGADRATQFVRSVATHTSRTSVAVRRFAPGSEWFYAKLYAGPAAADRVLRRLVAPLVASARDAGWIDRWFFIRYADPECHLRVRFHGPPDLLRRELLPALHDAAAPLLADGALWRVQLDTYERELERYGGEDAIDLAERIFEADSDAALEIVRLATGGGLSRDDRWRVTLRGIDALFADLGFDVGARRAIAGRMRDAYHKEHRADSAIGARLGERFRTERQALQAILDANDGDALAGEPLRSAIACLRVRSERLAPIVATLHDRERDGRLTVQIDDLASSFAHMHAVRMLRAAARPQEMVLFDFLCRLYERRAKRPERM